MAVNDRGAARNEEESETRDREGEEHKSGTVEEQRPGCSTSHSPRLRYPFQGLSSNNLIGLGAFGAVFRVSPHVAFKCPLSFDDPFPQQAQDEIKAIKSVAHEKEIYEVLMSRPHPNIARGIRMLEEGLFMEFLPETLETRLERPVKGDIQQRWVLELTSAVAWLEDFGLFHGDLRPSNIMLRDESIRLADFGEAAREGADLNVATEPFCRQDKNYDSLPAGPLAEQFSIASCVYNIRFGHIPLHNLHPVDRIRQLIDDQFPSTDEDQLFGEIIRDGWWGRYATLKEVQVAAAARSTLGETISQQIRDEPSIEALREECDSFLSGSR